MVFWPFSFWYTIGTIFVEDSVQGRGDKVRLEYSGVIHRPANIKYNVTVRNFRTHQIVSDYSSGVIPYTPNSTRPVPITFGWWSPNSPRLYNLEPGRYVMSTCWTIVEPFWGIVPPKSACAESNVFTIYPKGTELPKLTLDQK